MLAGTVNDSAVNDESDYKTKLQFSADPPQLFTNTNAAGRLAIQFDNRVSMKKSRSRKSVSKADDGKLRLQKLLAQHGHGSRRSCEEFILDGRVEVDGQVIKKLGSRVDPEKQKVTLDGERIIQPRLEYFMLNKPPGVVSTAKDPTGRIRVIDLIKTKNRVYNVGRLDKSSEGMILVTNDGDLANKLTHPRYGVEKKYLVTVVGRPSLQQLNQLKRGIYLAEAFVQVANVRVKKKLRDSTTLEIVLDEGRNREIRRILARIGHKVTELKRVAIGPLTLGDLPTGSHRRLTPAEVKLLMRFASGATVKRKPAKRSSRNKAVNLSDERKPGFRKGKVAGKKKATKRKSTKRKSTKRKSKGRKKAKVSLGRAKGRLEGRTTKKRALKKSSKSGVRKKRSR